MNHNEQILIRPSIINRRIKNNLIPFFLNNPFKLYNFLDAKDFWTLLFISCLALFVPYFWGSCILFLIYKMITQVQKNSILELENFHCDIVRAVELNQLESLNNAIDANPEILYCVYQRRSLVAWCRYYKNTRAQELIMQGMLKYPKEAIAL